MNLDQIKANAPSGATHYSETPMEYIFLKKYKEMWQCYAFGEWWHYDQEDGEKIEPL